MASQGMTADEAYNLANQMGLLDQKTIYATEKQALFKAMLDSGAISAETYTALILGLDASLEGLPADTPVNVNVILNNADVVDRYLANLTRQVTIPVNFSISGLPAEMRAGGGPVSEGMPYLVGEEGPEWFIPNTSGTVLPNGTGLVSSSSGSSGIDEATQALKEYNDELSNTGRIVDKLLTKDLPDIFSAKNLVISSKPIKDLVTSVRDYVISSNPIKDLITSAKNLVITSNPLLNLVTSAKNLVITSNEAQSLYSNSLLKARTETDLYSDSVLKARYDMSLYSDSVLKARSIMSLYSDDPTHGRTYSEPVFSRYGGAEKTDVGGTRNYYLTANYPQESQMSLIERVKVLEALG
jgi:hypothetical protein